MRMVLCAMTFAFVDAAGAGEPLAAEARAALEKATAYMRSISTQGGYLWHYSPDLKERWGEEKATATQISVQSPGTPAVGMAFLRAYEATGEARYLDGAKAAADALAAGQLESGGWHYFIELDPGLGASWYRRSDAGRLSAAEARKRRNVSVYDDDTTQGALRFLAAVADASKGSNDARDVRIREARDYGLKKLLAAQRPNGGWPQRWNGVPVNPAEYPVMRASIPANWQRQWTRGADYYGNYTLNDHAHRDHVLTLLDAARKTGVSAYRDAALRGGDFVLLAQLPEPQPAWAQQYNARMEPTWARAFEPPSVTTSESDGVMRLLVQLYVETGDKKYLEPLPRAIAWFKRSEIEPGRWARFYELGTNRPIYVDREGRIHYDYEKLPSEIRSYAWKGAFAIAGAMKQYDDAIQSGREKLLKRREALAKPSATSKATRARSLEARVRQIIAALDREGRWVSEVGGKPMISTETFSQNVRVLSDYLDANR